MKECCYHDVASGYKEAEKEIAASVGDEVAAAFLDGSITEIKSESATKVRDTVCKDLKQLVSVNLPNATTVGQSAFYGCTALTSVNMPSLTTVSQYGFNGCTNLRTLKIGQVTKIENCAFSGCNNLSRIDLSHVTMLGASIGGAGQAFMNCYALKEVVAPKLTFLNDKSFKYCRALEKADFTAVTAIDDSAFEGCSALKALILRRTDKIVTSGASIFSSIFKDSAIASGTGYIYVPAALVDAYKANSDWDDYPEQIRALEDYTVDGTVTGELDESKI